MRKLILVLMVLIYSVIILAEKKLVVGYENKENFPYYMGNTEKIPSENPGSVVELLKILGDELGMEVSFERVPWARGKYLLGQGEIDALFMASFKEERLELGQYPTKNGEVDPSRRIINRSYVIFKRKGDNLDWDGEKFINLTGKIGAPRGYSVVGDLKNRTGVIAEESPGTINDLKKLKARRLQGVAALELASEKILYQNEDLNSAVEKIDPPFVTKPYYVMLSHQFVEKNPELAEKIWDKIAELREKKLNELNKKYY